MPELNQIVFFTAVIFALGLAAIFRNSEFMKHGTIIVFSASILNFSVFSNYNFSSAEGQVIGLYIVIIIILHIFVQTKLLDEK